MKYVKTLLFLTLLLLSFTKAVYSEESNFSKIDISSTANLEIENDYLDFPHGEVTFNNVPFYIAEDTNNFFASNNNACPTCPVSMTISNLDIPQPLNVWLLVNSSDSFQEYDQSNFASLELIFSDSSKYTYDFIIGNNIREWLQSNNYGPTVNTVTDSNSSLAWSGIRPNGEFPVIADLLRIEIPAEFRSKNISEIKIIDDSLNRVTVGNPLDPGIIIKGVTIETVSLVSSSLNISSDYDSLNKQVPVDRDLKITVNVKNGLNQAVEGASVSAELMNPTMGTLVNTTATTINNGDAYFTFEPGATEGTVTIKFTYGDVVENYTFSLYRPPIVIVPGMGASFNLKKFYQDDNAQDNWSWSPTAQDGWDKVIQTLESNGYIKGSNYDIAFYDWRKSLDDNVYSDFQVESVYKNLKPKIDSLLQDKANGQKVNILAHSFGGLVTRTMIQQDWDDGKVNRFITFGSPHSGSTAAYYIWNGGQMPPTGDAMFRFTMGTLLKIYKHNYGLASLSTIHNTFPSVQQLLPVYENYFYRGNLGLGTNELTYLNSVLVGDVSAQSFIDDVNNKGFDFISVYGKGEQTLRNIKADTNVGIEIWPDGKPDKNQQLVDGDDSVLPESAKMQDLTSIGIESKHGDLPDNSLSVVLSQFNIPEKPVSNRIAPKMMLGSIVLSPAQSEIVNENGQVVSVSENWLEVDAKVSYATDLPDGLYTLRVKGTGTGNYLLYVPYAGKNVWEELEFAGTTTPNEIDTYQVFVNEASGSGMSKVTDTTMTWQIGKINLQKRQVPIEYVVTLPENFDTQQLQLDQVQLSGSWMPVLSSKVNKNGKKLHITLDGRDVAKAINWSEYEQITLLIGGNEESLLGTLKQRIPWALYRKYM